MGYYTWHKRYITKTLAAVTALVAGAFALSAGPATGTAVALADTTATSGVTNAAYGPAPASLHDFAPLSSIQVLRSGPADAAYTQAESKHMAPLVGSNAWRGFCQQSGRDLLIKLPVNVAVYSVSIQMEQVPNIGIFYPDHVDFEVNEQGQWYEADKVPSAIATWNKQNTTETFVGHFGNIDARELIIHFPVNSWVFARRIHVYGVNASQSESQSFPTLAAAPEEFGQAMTTSDDRDHGIQNMLLVYNDGTSQAGTWSVHDFLPMVGYMSSQGNFEDRMFDTMLFLPTGHLSNTQSSWYGFLSNLFSPGTQLSALNDAVGQVNSALAATSPSEATFKEKVVIALPYPSAGTGEWGTADGKSISFNGSKHDAGAVASRTEALRWYIETLLNAWNGANYSNLQLAGFYWLNEKIGFQSLADPQLVQSVSQLAASFQMPLFWIPYYDAGGIDEWPTEGFTAAWLQPNYVEGGLHPDPHRLISAEQLAADTGMGLEIEADWRIAGDSRYRQIYENMLRTLERDGMAGDVSHAYYAGSKVLVTAAYAHDAPTYGAYVDTYKFIQDNNG